MPSPSTNFTNFGLRSHQDLRDYLVDRHLELAVVQRHHLQRVGADGVREAHLGHVEQVVALALELRVRELLDGELQIGGLEARGFVSHLLVGDALVLLDPLVDFDLPALGGMRTWSPRLGAWCGRPCSGSAWSRTLSWRSRCRAHAGCTPRGRRGPAAWRCPGSSARRRRG